MSKSKQTLAFIIFSILILAAVNNYMYYKRKDAETSSKSKIVTVKPKVIYKTKVVYKDRNCSNSLLIINKDTLLNDIKRYSGISAKSKAKILTAIFKYSRKYNENPLVIYSLIATESSFKFWIKHSLSTIKIKDKKIQVRAIGLSAIIWEWWKDDLIENKIAETKSDLYDIDTNVEACCYIFNKLKNMPIMKGTKNSTESAMLRYFGGGNRNHWYIDRINNVLSSLMKQELYYKGN